MITMDKLLDKIADILMEVIFWGFTILGAYLLLYEFLIVAALSCN